MSPPNAASLILYVEDEVLIQELIQGALEDAGFEVFLAGTGDEALSALDAKAGEFAALITDVNLPGKLTGWDIARRARELAPALPVVYVSGDSSHEWSALGVPESLMLLKPFAPAQVVVAVSTLLNQASSKPGATAPGP